MVASKWVIKSFGPMRVEVATVHLTDAGVVTKLGRSKIQIRVAKRDNGSWVAAERWVAPDKLSGRISRASPEEAAQLIEPERNLWIKSS